MTEYFCTRQCILLIDRLTAVMDDIRKSVTVPLVGTDGSAGVAVGLGTGVAIGVGIGVWVGVAVGSVFA